MKLADGAVARRHHLAIRLPLPRGAHRVGIELAGQPVHLGAPRPEIVAIGGQPLGASAQSPLERVRVGVGHRGDSGDGGARRRQPITSMSSIAIATTRAATAASSRLDVLLRGVADAGGVANQHHRRRELVGQHTRVVAGEAHDLRRGAGKQCLSGQRQPRAQVLGERRCVGVRRDPDRELDARALGALARDPARTRPASARSRRRRAPARRSTSSRARGSWSGRLARSAAATSSRSRRARAPRPRRSAARQSPARRGAPPAASSRNDRRVREARPRAAPAPPAR